MSNQIFPDTIVEGGWHYYMPSIKTRTNIIYNSILLFVLATFIAVFFIQIDVSIKSNGIIQANKNRVNILAPATGRVKTYNINENQAIKIGDTLIEIDAFLLNNQLQHLEKQLQEANQNINDLSILCNYNTYTQTTSFYTKLYQQQFQYLFNQIHIQQNKISKLEKDLQKLKALEGKIIPKNDIIDKEFEIKQLKEEITLLITQNKSNWLSDLNKYQTQKIDIIAQINQLQLEKKNFTITSSIDGNIQQAMPLNIGDFIFANQQIVEITPESPLEILCYVTPSNIGLIKINQDVKLLIDAFNHNQWGIAHGKIVSISKDIFLDDNNLPFFKVKCSLDNEYLQLKNGYKGYLKKGMTVGARIKVANRTIFQLMFDKIDDWLNPALSNKKDA
ncbi:MAG: HlyD family efflux transporter periplasmic adaptor subunit [Chitinophagales bacterium]